MRNLNTSLIASLFALSIFLQGCNKDKGSNKDTALKYGTMTDIDGNEYVTVQIGSQTWMAENLKVTRYNDGTSIPHITDDVQWRNQVSGAYCIYHHSAENDRIYGKLYNWYAASSDKLCPKGWHIPAEEEWEVLVEFLGGFRIANDKLKSIGTVSEGTGLWDGSSGGTNESGFNGLPGGFRNLNVGNSFFNLGYFGYWWSSSNRSSSGRGFYLSAFALRGEYDKYSGLSCRCLKD